METKDIILKLRKEKGLSQNLLAEKLFVSRQAVSRWETGETNPSVETLKLLAKEFDVSISTLLNQDEKAHICQCCGMPLDNDNISFEKDGTKNSSYCKWCYSNGNFNFHNMDDLIEVSVNYICKDNNIEKEEVQKYFKALLPKLDYWKDYKYLSGKEKFEEYKNKLINEINKLKINGLPKISKLNPLLGCYVNLEYRLPNNKMVKFLNNDVTYLGTEVECEFDKNILFGVVTDLSFILVASYEINGDNPELIIYKRL